VESKSGSRLEPSGKQTEMAIQAHINALGQGVDEILKGYGDDAILLSPKGPVQGKAAIREYYEDFISDILPLLAASYNLLRFDVIGEAAYLTWKAEPSIPIGTDTYLVHKGKIVLHTTTHYMQP
jgi:ketosteroid isomerase-like protein